MANSVDPDQTPLNAASDQGLHCLLRLSVRIFRVNTVGLNFFFYTNSCMAAVVYQNGL